MTTKRERILLVAALLLLFLLVRYYQDKRMCEEEQTRRHLKDVSLENIRRWNFTRQQKFNAIENKLARRRQSMLEYCGKYSPGKSQPTDVIYANNRFLKASLFFSDKYKIVFCQIPKCATRSQAQFLAIIEGLMQVSKSGKMSGNGAQLLIEEHRSARKASNIAEIVHKLDTYTKIVIVREPFSRLLSAFRNKLEKNREKNFYTDTAKKMHKKYGNGSGEELDGAPVIKLDDFISHLTDKTIDGHTDPHWNFFHRLCSPCELKYDYIMQLKDIEEDMEYLIEKFNMSNVNFPPSFNSFTDKEILSKYFQKLSPKLVNELYQTYKMDYELFGYPPPPQF